MTLTDSHPFQTNWRWEALPFLLLLLSSDTSVHFLLLPSRLFSPGLVQKKSIVGKGKVNAQTLPSYFLSYLCSNFYDKKLTPLWWIYVSMHLFTLIASTVLEWTNHHVNYGLWVIIMCHCKFINCKKNATWVRDVDHWRGSHVWEQGVDGKLHLLSFAVNLKLVFIKFKII